MSAVFFPLLWLSEGSSSSIRTSTILFAGMIVVVPELWICGNWISWLSCEMKSCASNLETLKYFVSILSSSALFFINSVTPFLGDVGVPNKSGVSSLTWELSSELQTVATLGFEGTIVALNAQGAVSRRLFVI